ncbi:hypothetical protein [Streptomyces sp. NBC_00645]|uniref:hypothetical protein n=1 Tax=Streptomyces sp. NBC_00645 TaxID=2975795 RepID=UPI003244FA48
MLDQIGLYYPHIHCRNEEWLKTAALYWPQLARVVPADYDLRDLPTTRAPLFALGIYAGQPHDRAG